MSKLFYTGNIEDLLNKGWTKNMVSEVFKVIHHESRMDDEVIFIDTKTKQITAYNLRTNSELMKDLEGKTEIRN